jgi:hypothetical protein
MGAAGCAGVVGDVPPLLPVANTIVREPLLIHSTSPLPAQHRLFEDLSAQRKDMVARLDLPSSDEPIHVYLFESPQAFEAFIRVEYPQFPARRAFFVEGDTRLAVYAQWGDRVAEDLRHEVAHGYLHAALRNIPLWLDEGLAEYFEVARGTRGLNRPHVADLGARLSAGGWRPDLARLEQLTAAGEMTQLDYAESWAWVHWLLETTPERRELVCAYLRDLNEPEPAGPLSARIVDDAPDAPRALAEHIFGLALAP